MTKKMGPYSTEQEAGAEPMPQEVRRLHDDAEMSLDTATEIATGIFERSQIKGYAIVSAEDRRALIADIAIDLRVTYSRAYRAGRRAGILAR